MIVRGTIGVRRTIAVRCTREQPNNRRGRADEELLWATTRKTRSSSCRCASSTVAALFGPRDRREWHNERAVAERVKRHREQWEGRGRGPGRTPGRMRGPSLADTVDVAVAIADAEGTEAVSMRRIARDLRVGAMSLYWHVESKEELHQLMLETVHAEIGARRRRATGERTWRPTPATPGPRCSATGRPSIWCTPARRPAPTTRATPSGCSRRSTGSASTSRPRCGS